MALGPELCSRALMRDMYTTVGVGPCHKKQTGAIGLGLWGIAGSKLQGENLMLGQGQSCGVGATWMPVLSRRGFGLWVWPSLRTTRGT